MKRNSSPCHNIFNICTRVVSLDKRATKCIFFNLVKLKCSFYAKWHFFQKFNLLTHKKVICCRKAWNKTHFFSKLKEKADVLSSQPSTDFTSPITPAEKHNELHKID